MKKRLLKYGNKKPDERDVSNKQLTRRNFIAFGTFAGLSAIAYGGWRWLYNSPAEPAGITGNAHKPLRRALNQNERIFRRGFSHKHLVKTYPKNMAAKRVRFNGDVGMQTVFDPAQWKLTVNKSATESFTINFNELLKLPKTELVFDFKCVEGWDQVQHWGGVKFSDFIDHFGLHEQAKTDYVGFVTPDKQYYVGIDMPSALHPQTLLAYEMNGRPMPVQHGFPLRLIIPVKYGIKSLKRIATINFSNIRPPDYWAERGYDYYSGL